MERTELLETKQVPLLWETARQFLSGTQAERLNIFININKNHYIHSAKDTAIGPSKKQAIINRINCGVHSNNQNEHTAARVTPSTNLPNIRPNERIHTTDTCCWPSEFWFPSAVQPTLDMGADCLLALYIGRDQPWILVSGGGDPETNPG